MALCSQVTEETAQVVQSVGYGVTLRGVVNVKGKGELTTYFVNTDQLSPKFWPPQSNTEQTETQQSDWIQPLAVDVCYCFN